MLVAVLYASAMPTRAINTGTSVQTAYDKVETVQLCGEPLFSEESIPGARLPALHVRPLGLEASIARYHPWVVHNT